jgi:hypothetical protein
MQQILTQKRGINETQKNAFFRGFRFCGGRCNNVCIKLGQDYERRCQEKEPDTIGSYAE